MEMKNPQILNFKNNKMKIFCLFLTIALFSINISYSQNLYDDFYKGIAAFEYKEYQNAIDLFSKSIQNEKVDYQDYISRGKTYYELENYQMAIEDFIKAEELKSGTANYLIAECYAKSGNIDSTIFYLKENFQSTSKVLKSEIFTDEAFNYVSTTDEWNIFFKEDNFTKQELLLNDVNYNLNKGDYIEALDIVNKIIKKNRNKHQAFVLKGDIFFKLADYKSAAECYDEALKINKNNLIYREKLAISYMNDGKYKKALEECNAIIEKNPKNIKMYYYKALINYNLDNFAIAKDECKTYLNYFYNDLEVKLLYAEMLINSEDNLNAIIELNKLIELNPSKAEYYYLRGKAYLNSNSILLAIGDFNYSLDLNPKLTEIYLLRGQAKQLTNDIVGACLDWNKSIENNDYKANNYIIKYCNQ
jgi:tetratricopeptide (TPR) repeat protein